MKIRHTDPLRFHRAAALNWPLVSVIALGGVVWCGIFHAAALLVSRSLF